MRDCVVKGRLRDRKGGHNNNTRLTVEQVLEIRVQYAQGKSQTALGRQFGVNQPAIGKIVNRKTWAHI